MGRDATWRPAEASIRCALLASFSTAAAADAAATSPAAVSGSCWSRKPGSMGERGGVPGGAVGAAGRRE